MAVSFNYVDINAIPLANKKRVKDFIIKIFQLEQLKVSRLAYIFTTDEYVLSLNRDFLQHDYYTDVLTFDQSEENGSISGEVYISVPRVKENSKTEGVLFSKELLRVMFHAALHLCGYRDKTKSEITQMREKEEEYLLLFEKICST
jgi:rRNA maturation RNase YbeY